MGDFNINLFNYDSHTKTADFINLMFSYSYAPFINKPTRITEQSSTLIDNIFVNNYNDNTVADRYGPWTTSPRFDTAQTRKRVRSRTEAAQ